MELGHLLGSAVMANQNFSCDHAAAHLTFEFAASGCSFSTDRSVLFRSY